MFGYPGRVSELADWFLTAEERGNPGTKIPAWCAGNNVQPLIHGSTYFDQLVSEVESLGDGDYLFFTDWRGDPDQMRDDGPTIRAVLLAAERGVVVKGLVWRSHSTSSPTARKRTATSARPSNGRAARCCWTSVSGSAVPTTRSWW